MLRKKPGAAPRDAPARPGDRTAGRRPHAADGRAEIRQAQIRHDRRRSDCWRSPPIGYGVYFILVGRFYVSTDDAYVRANNTTLGARVAGHVAAILPGDNAIVRTGDVIFRIDDGDYRIAVDAARTKIATQQATIDRIGRQVTALESAVEQAKAQLASAEAGAEARRSRLRPPAGAEHQGLCLARHLRSVRSRPRPGRRRGEGRRRRPMTPRATMSR